MRVSSLVEPEGPRSVRASITHEEDVLVRSMLDASASARPTAAEFLQRWQAIGDSEIPRALVIDERGEIGPVVEARLARVGFAVELTSDPRRASRAVPGDFALIVLSAELRSIDPVKLTQHLEEFLPEQALWIVGRSFGLAWQRVQRARCVRVPDELATAIAVARSSFATLAPPSTPTPTPTPPPSKRSVSAPPAPVTPAVEAFIGGGADLYAQLIEASTTRDEPALLSAGEKLAHLAAAAGANHVASLARTLGALVRGRELEDASAFVEELGSAYREAVRSILRPNNL